MPIHFRCPSCYGLLSIARRKSGHEVTCPKCSDLVIVPILDAQDDEVTMVVEVDSESARERENAARTRRQSEGRNRDHPADPDGVVVLASVDEPVKPSRKPKKSGGDDSPLFERSDFEQLLEPAARKAVAANGAKGLAGTGQPAAPVQPDAPVAMTAQVSDDDGLTITRGGAAMLAVMIAVLLALAFATGFLISS